MELKNVEILRIGDLQTFDGGFKKGAAVNISSGAIPGGYGFMSGAAPTAADAYARIVGYATDKGNIIYFNPGTSWVELS